MIHIAVAAGLGFFAWTFLEYGLHRFVGHLKGGRNEITREHLAHHSVTDYFTPALKKLLLAVPVLGSLFGLGLLVVPVTVAAAFTAGLGTGWFLYEFLHRGIHRWAPTNAYGRWLRRHHLHHHFGNPRKNHGVITPLWDHVFRTWEEPGVIKVPHKQAVRLRWLVADAERFADDYRVG